MVGIDGTIVLGRHYYALCHIRRSCWGIVYTFVMGVGITNTYHDDGPRSMLRQLMALWYKHLIIHDGFFSKCCTPCNLGTNANMFLRARSSCT